MAAAVALLGAGYFWPGARLAVLPARLPDNVPIQITTRPEHAAVNLGDAFWYYVEVWYNPADVAQIDRASLDQQMDLQPFEVRGTNERDYPVSPGTRVYEKGYRLQFISGHVDMPYTFPPITVHYRLQDGTDVNAAPVTPQPVFVASRMPAEPNSVAFRPVESTVLDVRSARLPWIFWTLGGVLFVLLLVPLTRRSSVPSRPARVVDAGVVAEAYRALDANARQGAEPTALLHQIDHILRLVLARQEHLDWLSEPVAQAPAVGALLARCEKAYTAEPVEQAEVASALAELREILAGYYGRQEVAAWAA